MMLQNRQAPLLDRKAVLGISGPGQRIKGVWHNGDVIRHSIWLCLRALDLAQEPSGVDGWFQAGALEVITRYRRDVIVEAVSGDVGMQTGHAFLGWYLALDGAQFTILNAAEMPEYGRRRFMALECERR